ncbi:MAG: YjbQ family protein [Erysipelotrichaceae bacterium]|nr:YjbQ family protein [Erysipelotrichaceae bacterium]MDY5728135.1 YjbQ family protein [Erysipelotrichaceae bacterium]
MSVYSEKITVVSDGKRISYHEITARVREAVKKSKITQGIVAVCTVHTTCSVFYEEMVHDRNWYGDEFLQVDLNEVMEKIIPTCTTEGMYHYPGPLHAKFAEEEMHDDKTRCLNTDAHLRATLVGNSVTLPVIDAEVVTGKFGYIYFVDWDRKVERERSIYIQVLGE